MAHITTRLAIAGTFASLFCSPVRAQVPIDRAWSTLEQGIKSDDVETRTHAVEALGLIPRNERARKLAETGLGDSDPAVRSSAATSLGQIGLTSATPQLEKALTDKEVEVVLAAAGALAALKDPAAYRVYYAVLTGQRKSGQPLLESQLKMLKDPDALTKIGFEAGIGFIPFGGVGYKVFKSFKQDNVSPVRAAAAQRLASDPDPASGQALAAAAKDEHWIVRASALSAIARRGDRALIGAAQDRLGDDEPVVRFTAAAAVVRLSGAPAKAPAK